MDKSSPDECRVVLKNSSGVPIIEVIGSINEANLRIIERIITALETAGHYNIVVNIRRVLANNLELLTSLAKCVGRIRGHYGNIDLVAEAAQIKQMANDGLARLFRLCTSESQALTRIKGLLRSPEEPAVTSASIMES